MSYGKYSTYASLVEAYKEGEVVFHINHFRINDNLKNSRNRIVSFLIYLIKILLPALIVSGLNFYTYESAYWWVVTAIILVFSYIIDPSRLSLFISILLLVLGFAMSNNLLVLFGFGLFAAFVCAKICWTLLEDVLKKEITSDEKYCEQAWEKELFLIQIGDELYSSKRKARVLKKGVVM